MPVAGAVHSIESGCRCQPRLPKLNSVMLKAPMATLYRRYGTTEVSLRARGPVHRRYEKVTINITEHKLDCRAIGEVPAGPGAKRHRAVILGLRFGSSQGAAKP